MGDSFVLSHKQYPPFYHVRRFLGGFLTRRLVVSPISLAGRSASDTATALIPGHIYVVLSCLIPNGPNIEG